MATIINFEISPFLNTCISEILESNNSLLVELQNWWLSLVYVWCMKTLSAPLQTFFLGLKEAVY